MPLPTKANVVRPEAWGYDVLVEYGDADAESAYLRAAVGPGRNLSFQTVEPQERSPDLSENPEDMRSETGRTFSRSEFSGGEGLDRAHRRDGTDRDWSRYWDSRGVDVFPARAGEPARLKLAHSTTLLRSAEVAAGTFLLRVGGTLYGVISDRTGVDITSDPTAASPSWSTEDPSGGGFNVTGLAALGSDVYAATGAGGIWVRSGGSWSLAGLGSDPSQKVWAAKGRILSSAGVNGSDLYEESTLLHSLSPGDTWNDVADAGAAVLAAASDGYVYVFAEEDGALVLKGQTLFEGEEPTSLAAVHGLVFVGTQQDVSAGGKIGRLWRTVLVGLRLREAQVLRQWGDADTTLDQSPYRIVASRESVWTAVVEDADETHVWRYDVTTGGMVRQFVSAASDRVHGIAFFDDRAFFAVRSSGLWREDTTFVDEGWLIGPLADHFNAAKKTWVGARLSAAATPTGTQAALAYSTDPDAIEDAAHASWTDVAVADEDNPGDDEEPIVGAESRYLTGKITLTANGANTATPEVLAYAFRALPLPTESDYAIPVNVSDRLEMPHRRPLLIPGLGADVRDNLLGLVGKSATVTILPTGDQVIGQIRGVSEPVQELPERGSPSVYALLTVRGARQ